jgi:hypothetical protein
MCDYPTHSAPQMKIVSGKYVSNDKGYRLAKASHGVWEGTWYYEVSIDQQSAGHTRIGKPFFLKKNFLKKNSRMVSN